jgi:membrane protein
VIRRDKEAVAGEVQGTLQRLDRYQQRHPALGVPIAVVRKFVEDQSTILAAAIAFWAFFSVFPLLLVFVTTTQAALNSVWELPYAQRSTFGAQIGRSLIALSAIGIALVGSTVINNYITGTTTGTPFGVVGGLAGYLIAVALDVGLFIVAFRLLTDRDVAIRDVLPGALLSGVVFWLLQQLSSLIISRYLHTAERAYGTFATVITILWWFYLGSIVTLAGAQLNVVLKERLHPRRLVEGPTTTADYQAYDTYAKERTYHQDEEFHTEFPHHETNEG